MRIAIWKQDRKGAPWRRLGVVRLDMGRQWPFKKSIRHGEAGQDPFWPRHCWYSIERDAWSLFDHEGRA